MSRWRRILQSATEFAVVVTDRDGTITEWNTGAERILGWTADAMIGEDASRIFTPEDRAADRIGKEMGDALAEGRGLDERWHVKADGTRFWASGEMMPLREADGSHVGFVKILRDRTEQHRIGVELERSRAELVRSESKWRGLFDDMREGFYVGEAVRDAAGRMVDYRYLETNAAFEALTGFHGAAGRLASQVAPETVAATVARYAPMLESGEPAVFEVFMPDAGNRWFEMRTRPLDGDRYAVVFADIDERKRAQIDLADVDRRRRIASEVGEVGIFDLDLRDGRLIWDERVRRAFGLADGREPVQAEKLAAVHAGDRAEFERRFAAAVAGGPDFDMQFRVQGIDDGVLRWVTVKGQVIGENGGQRMVGAVRDVSDQVEVEARIAASEAKWRGLFEDLQEGFLVGRLVRDASGRAVDWRYEEANRAFGVQTGVDPASVVGRTITEVFPDIEDEWVREFIDVVERQEAAHFTRPAATLGRWYDGVAQPAGDDRFTVIFLEVTDRKMAERRLEALRELGDALLLLDDPDAMSAAADAIVGRTLRVGRAGYGTVLEDGETFIVPTDWTAEGYPSLAGTYRMSEYGGYAEDLRQGRTVVIPDIRLDPRTARDTEPLERLAVRSLINHPIVEDGRTVAVLYVNNDVPRDWSATEVTFIRDAALRTRTAIERRRAEKALQESDHRFRTFVENVDVGICILEVEFDAAGKPVDYLYLDANPAMETQAGVKDVVGRRVSEIVPGIEQYWKDLYGGVATTGEPQHVQYEAAALGRWFDIRALKVGAPEDRRVAVLFTDVTGRVQADERRTVLNRELAHRLKNTLAIVQSIATQTLRVAPDMTSARKTLTERIGVLAKAHDILLTGQRDAASVAEIVRAATGLHDEGGRIHAEGTDIRLGPKAALTLSLILHELSTNAGKYGALSVDEGHVDVDWTVTADPTTRRPFVTFEWREVGGPPVTAPERKSFGTRLIEMGISGSAEGSSELAYAPEGLRCRITASLTELQTEEEAERGE